MRSTHGSRAAWLAAFLFLLSPLASLRAAETAAKEETGPAKTEAAETKSEQADAGADKADVGEKSASVGHKSPGVAGGLAFFPGLAVHGTGHMYAGSWVKGLGLLAIEAAAVGVGVVTVTNGYNDIQKLMEGTKNGATPSNFGTAYQTLGITMVCVSAFLWTWFDDMAGAPIAAAEYNKLADEAAGQAHLEFAPTGDGARLALVSNF